METVLILVAVVALAISGVTVGAMAARSRRPPLRLPNEHRIEQASDDGLMDDIEAPLPSPIDRRSGAVLDLEPIESQLQIAASRRAEAPRRRDDAER
ncbi:hypothetical protein ASG40_09385 [Methylobacterium sp. Leaf399]|nr:MULTISPECIES: hypothetical protein [unclassified Methylobacterium]KQP55191.1 hypothetical protein ASF39_05625 [Methylobacterium sp. Leaf108]KQT09931.1 hypothetical protein ASG40_09385 [Methylobacterium sp. Leaf399]KQT77836.1 hypothetical protein ASG59_10920 [Methylobacterium sp. Leaf466]